MATLRTGCLDRMARNHGSAQKSNLILWEQGPMFPQGLNKFSQLLYTPKLVGLYEVEESINTTTQTSEGMEGDLVSGELLQ